MSAPTLADRILQLSSARIPRRQLDLAITVIMLQQGGRNALLGYSGVRKGRYRIDHGFVSDLLKATKDPRIIQSPAFACLSRPVFRRLFFQYWRRRRDESWRLAFAWSLKVFLMDSPRDAPIYAEPIWSLAMDPDESVACQALQAAQYLGAALTLEQCKALIGFTSHQSIRSGASMTSLGSVYKDFKNLRPEVRALLLEPATMATLRRATPNDGRDKNSTYRWCITNMRKVLARTRRGRIPRLVR